MEAQLLGSRELRERSEDGSLGPTRSPGLREVEAVAGAGSLDVEDTSPLLLEVQVSAHSVHVAGAGSTQAAVHGRLGLLHTLQPVPHIAGAARTAPSVRSGAQAVRVLAAAPAVAVCAGVTGPATPAVALVVGQARADDRRTYLAAVGMLAATSTPVLTQVRHCARAAVPFVAQAALAAVTRSAHGLGRAGGGAHGLQLKLHLAAWPSPALLTEAGARAPKALVTVAMHSAAAGLAVGPKGTRGAEFTC